MTRFKYHICFNWVWYWQIWSKVALYSRYWCEVPCPSHRCQIPKWTLQSFSFLSDVTPGRLSKVMGISSKWNRDCIICLPRLRPWEATWTPLLSDWQDGAGPLCDCASRVGSASSKGWLVVALETSGQEIVTRLWDIKAVVLRDSLRNNRDALPPPPSSSSSSPPLLPSCRSWFLW